jgi:uncharacterized protein YxjI
MPSKIDIHPGESYMIRRKVFKIFGAAFHIYDPAGNVVGYCKQKAFKFKEDLRVYTDESCTTELMVIKARSILDFGATYDVTLGTGQSLGSLRRKGMTSTFLRDHWLIYTPDNRQIAEITEDGSFLAFARRFIELVAALSPQTFTIKRTTGGAEGQEIAKFRQHFHLFVYKLSVTVAADDPELDDLVILAAGCLIAAIEGRQSGG